MAIVAKVIPNRNNIPVSLYSIETRNFNASLRESPSQIPWPRLPGCSRPVAAPDGSVTALVIWPVDACPHDTAETRSNVDTQDRMGPPYGCPGIYHKSIVADRPFASCTCAARYLT